MFRVSGTPCLTLTIKIVVETVNKSRVFYELQT